MSGKASLKPESGCSGPWRLRTDERGVLMRDKIRCGANRVSMARPGEGT